MLDLEVRKLNPGYEDRDYTRMKEFLERNIFKELAGKAEAGSTRSESGYQRIAASVSGAIARELGCGEDRAQALSMAAGLFLLKTYH